MLTKKAIANLLTVEYSKVPGKTFHRKVLSKYAHSRCPASLLVKIVGLEVDDPISTVVHPSEISSDGYVPG
jgi:hypothetical protein